MHLKPLSDIEPALYVVSTPIGNLEDITLRALRILKHVSVVACEDTRKTSRLIRHYDIKTPLVSCHEHNEIKRSEELVKKIQAGKAVALVSDAGTPSISDPGFRFVGRAVALGVKVIPIPGVSAAVAALSVSGLSTDSFVFVGFPPKKQGRRRTILESLSGDKRTLIFYESPHRIVRFLKELLAVFGVRVASLSREITKLHEEHVRGSLDELLDVFEKRESIKGEITLIVSGYVQDKVGSFADIESDIKKQLKDKTIKKTELARKIASKYGLNRKDVYDQILKISDI